MISIFKKILSLLTDKERKKFYLLFAAITFSGIIEVAGIAPIMPFLSLITNQNVLTENKYLLWLYESLHFQSINHFLIFLGVSVLLILIISNALMFLSLWGLARFSWMRNHTISRRLLISYLMQPYSFFLSQNTNKLGKNILSEVQETVNNILIPTIQIFSRGIVVLLIFILLLIIEPFLALILLAVFGGSYILIYSVVRRKLNEISALRFKTNTERYKTVNEAFGDIKLLKLMNKEEYFIDSYSKPSYEYARLHSINLVISYLPRHIMEIIALGGIIVVVLYLIISSSGLNEFLPLIGIYAFATYRLVPAIQLIFTSIAQIRFSSKALDMLVSDMNTFAKSETYFKKSKEISNPINLKKQLELKNISFSYPGTQKPTLKNINLEIKANTSVGFAGMTGSGKTTLANIILGLLKPDAGLILVDGIEINDENLLAWQRNLGYIPQDINLYDDTVAQNIAFGVPKKDISMDKVKEAAMIANIHDFIKRELPQDYETIVGEKGIRLSGGQRQRIGIARALYHNPSVLVLDEATSSLDSATENEVFKAIENIAKKKTLIIIAHRLTTIEGCDIIYLLENGNIIGSGNYHELIDSSAQFKKLAKS